MYKLSLFISGLLVVLGINFPCFSQQVPINCVTNPALDMGSFGKLDHLSGTYEVDLNGIQTSSSNMRKITDPIAGYYVCTRLSGGPGFIWSAEPVCTDITVGCPAQVSLKFGECIGASNCSWNLATGESRSIPYGIALNIAAGCQPGTYTSQCTATMANVNGNPIPASALAPITFTFTVKSYLAIIKTKDLNFGRMRSRSNVTVAVVDPSGNHSGTVDYLLTNPNISAATFEVQGTQNMAFEVSVPTSVLLRNAGGDTLTVRNFTSSLNAFAGSTNASGTAVFDMGATLEVPAYAPKGQYNGEFTVMITY